MRVKISKAGKHFIVDPMDLPGSPAVGRGRTMMEALGSFFHHHQDRFEVEFVVDSTAQAAETNRRRRELKMRGR